MSSYVSSFAQSFLTLTLLPPIISHQPTCTRAAWLSHLGDAVVEGYELPIRGEEAQAPAGFKVRHVHALVEVAIVQHHRTPTTATGGRSSANHLEYTQEVP